VLTSDPGHLAVPALAVAVETSPSVGDQIADALTDGDWPIDLLDRLASALPDASVALARTAATFQRLASASAGDAQNHGRNLIRTTAVRWARWLPWVTGTLMTPSRMVLLLDGGQVGACRALQSGPGFDKRPEVCGEFGGFLRAEHTIQCLPEGRYQRVA
jgi:hypothetical protein